MKNGISGNPILVIDDNPALLRAINKVLSGEGATVTCANGAEDGIEILTKREKQIDLVITDLRMPFINGITVVYAIHEIFPLLPVIVLTALGDPETKAVCLQQGAVAFLEKPLESQELCSPPCEARCVAVQARLGGQEPRPDNLKNKNDKR